MKYWTALLLNIVKLQTTVWQIRESPLHSSTHGVGVEGSGRWEVGPKNGGRWDWQEVECRLSKTVGDGRLARKKMGDRRLRPLPHSFTHTALVSVGRRNWQLTHIPCFPNIYLDHMLRI